MGIKSLTKKIEQNDIKKKMSFNVNKVNYEILMDLLDQYNKGKNKKITITDLFNNNISENIKELQKLLNKGVENE